MVWVACLSWDQRRVRGGPLLFILCFSTGLWSLCEGALCFAPNLETGYLITQIQYLGITATIPLSLFFVAVIFGYHDHFTGRRMLIISAIPALILIMAWTNSLHHLIWTDWRLVNDNGLPMIQMDHGLFFWIFVAYVYSMLTIMTAMLLQTVLNASKNLCRQARLVLYPALLVWACNLIYITGNSPLKPLDPTPLAFALVAGGLALCFFRYRLLRVSPITKHEIFAGFSDAVLLLDTDDIVIDMNPAAEKLLGVKSAQTMGISADTAFAEKPDIIGCLRGESLSEMSFNSPVGEHTYDLSISHLKDRKGVFLGRMLVWRDITRRKQLELELQSRAQTDPLTGIHNRRSFISTAEKEIKRAQRYQRPLTLLMLDLDRFKSINDTYGHAAGDEALKAFTRCCLSMLRESDFFARIGGEEFAVLCLETPGDEALSMAERIRNAIKQINLIEAGGEGALSVSIGLAELEKTDGTDNLLNRADQALYSAKNRGRDQVWPERPPTA